MTPKCKVQVIRIEQSSQHQTQVEITRWSHPVPDNRKRSKCGIKLAGYRTRKYSPSLSSLRRVCSCLSSGSSAQPSAGAGVLAGGGA
jgi:hypothetical protein